jgi:PKD repeat protein
MRFSFRRNAIALVAVLCTLGFVGVVLAAPPAVDFSFTPTTPLVGSEVDFNATVTDDAGDTHTYAWNFGDGNTSTDEDPSHTYTELGTKSITLTVTDFPGGETTTITRTLRVNAPPTAQVNCSPDTVAPGVGTTCSSSGSSDPEGTGLTYAWDIDGDGFDDGSDPNETFTFASSGTPTIRLQVRDSDNATATAQDTVTVTNSPPVASLGVSPNPARISQTVNFNGSNSRDPGGSIALYEFDLDGNPGGPNGGFEVSGTNPTPSRSYASANSYTIRLRVVDNEGGSAIDSETLHIFANVPPSVSASASPNPAQIGQSVSFNSSAADGDGTVAQYEWDLDGDGAFDPGPDPGPTPNRTYTTAGTRTLKVRVTDNDGAVATDVFSLRINARPTPSFTISPNPALIREAIQLDASSSGDFDGTITTYQWDFDYNGTTFNVDDTGITSTTSYTMDGTKAVALRVTDNDNATTVLSRPVTVQVTRPNAAFAFSPQAPLPGQAVAFTSQSAPSGSSSAQIVSTEWDFNYDPTREFGADASGAAASTTFSTPGAKTVAVKVTETGGGFDIASGTVVVNAPPEASFGASGSFLDGDSVTLSSTSGDPDGPITAQQWDLDADGQFDDAAGAVISKALKKGAHTVRLRVTDSRGATATSERRIDVLARPLKLLTGVKVTLFGNLTARGVRLKRLLVRTPGKANVKVTCKGKKCPKGARAASTRPAKTKRVRFKKFERAFPAGTLITVTVTRPGYIGQQTTIKIRKGLRRYIRRDSCLRPGSSKPIACPDS